MAEDSGAAFWSERAGSPVGEEVVVSGAPLVQAGTARRAAVMPRAMVATRTRMTVLTP